MCTSRPVLLCLFDNLFVGYFFFLSYEKLIVASGNYSDSEAWTGTGGGSEWWTGGGAEKSRFL